MCRREIGGTGILGVGGEEYVLTELNQLLTGTGGGRMVDLGCRRSLSLGWVVQESAEPGTSAQEGSSVPSARNDHKDKDLDLVD